MMYQNRHDVTLTEIFNLIMQSTTIALVKLDLSTCLDAQFTRLVSLVFACPTLEELNLHGHVFSDESLATLGDALQA